MKCISHETIIKEIHSRVIKRYPWLTKKMIKKTISHARGNLWEAITHRQFLNFRGFLRAYSKKGGTARCTPQSNHWLGSD